MMKQLMAVLISIVCVTAALASDELEKGFTDPPLQAKSRCFWDWVNGNVDKAAITKDLEWMKRIGMGGGLILHVGGAAGSTPAGPAFNSPAWRELFKHAVAEADRLGLELSLSPQSGWNLGGPTVKPVQAGKHLTWSAVTIAGPRHYEGKLPQPPVLHDWYQDTRLVAYRLKPAFIGTVARPEVVASSSVLPRRPDAVLDGQTDSYWTSKRRPPLSDEKPEWLQLTFAAPVAVSGLTILPVKTFGPKRGEFQVSEDGERFTTVGKFLVADKGPILLQFAAVTGRYFRLVLQEAFAGDKFDPAVGIAELALLDSAGHLLDFGKINPPVSRLEFKAGYHQDTTDWTVNDPLPFKPGDEDVAAGNVIELTQRLEKDGTLRWDVPEGIWQVLRFGCTLNGGHVSFGCGWDGYVLDYLDPNAIKSYWREVIDPLLDDIQPYLGKAFRGIETDSWEGGGLNWTASLPEEFKTRRGYDPVRFLPVFAGKIVDSREASNRFLYDWRKTIADEMADNHYGVMAALAATRGLVIHCEAGGPHNTSFDALKNLGRCDWPMGEFWVPSGTQKSRNLMKGPASAAHIYGKSIICGESFTSWRHWDDILWSMQKPFFDHEACAGLNLIFWHGVVCSPDSMGVPGQQFFAGTHFNPQVTWANQAHAFIEYLNRCQFMLQQGQFLADVCYYYGDHAPNVPPGDKDADPAKVLPNYDYDYLNEEQLLKMQAKEGKLVLPSGMSYRLLVLPKLKILSLNVLKKVAELVKAGGIVVGPRPERNPSLTGGPEADAIFKSLCDELWGQGKVFDKPAKEVLSGLGVPPDFEAQDVVGTNKLDFIHRRDGQAEIYFLSNQAPEMVRFTGVFRVSGKQPELWDAVTGKRRDLPQFECKEGRTSVPLELEGYGSAFVVFREKGSGFRVQGSGEVRKNFPELKTVMDVNGPWQVQFDPKWGGPMNAVVFDTLTDWTSNTVEGIKYYSGTATYRKFFDVGSAVCGLKSVVLDLGAVKEMAEVRLNGKNLGVVWCPPWRVEITDVVKPTGNVLEIDVVNNWPNRLIGDGKLPPEKRFTKTNYPGWYNRGSGSKEQPLFPAGLLGPVRVLATKGGIR